MNKPITIEDITREAGVSASTVSRVLNGSKRVADDKRALVMAAIEHHNFRPNMMARGLVRGRTMMIGVLAQDIDSPFFSKMVGGIEERLAHTPYRPMLTTTKWDTENDEDIARSLGTVGHLTRLRRTWVEPFRDQPMVTLETALAGAPARQGLLPADAALQALPRAALSETQAAAVRQGQAVRHEAGFSGRRVRIYGPDGAFMGLAEGLPDGRLQPRRLLVNASPKPML